MTDTATSQEGQVRDDGFLADERYVLDGYRSASIDGWDTRIFDEGSGEAIFFVPIIRGLEVVYARQLRAFSATNRVLLYERTESVDRPRYVRERVDELVAILDHLGIERAHFVGLGDAGVPTFNVGRYYPDRVITLTSLCLGPRYRVPPYWLNEGIINPLTEKLPLEGLVPNRLIRAMIIKGTYGNGPLPPHLIGHMVDHIPEQMRVHKYSVLPVTHHHEMRDWARDLNVPVLLINRDDDPLAPQEEMVELAELLPRCYGLKVLHDGGRFITYTHADDVERLLRQFFADVASGKPADAGLEKGPGTSATPQRASTGPLVSDEQWQEDQAWVREHSQHQRIDGWETELFDVGGGEPILYIPILGHVEVIYARQLRDFSRDYRAITYRRPESTDHPVWISERVEEVRQLLDHLGVDRAHIVGRGEGAIVASEFALKYPDRTRSLVMVSLGMEHKVPPTIVTNTLNWFLLNTPIDGTLLTDKSWRLKVVKYLSGEDQRLTYDQIMSVYSHIPDFIKVCKYSVTPLVSRHNLRGRAQDILPPTLLITTDEDPRATREDLDELAAALPDCRGVHVVPQGGRFVNYIQGDEVNRLIRDFYGGIAVEPARAASGSEA